MLLNIIVILGYIIFFLVLLTGLILAPIGLKGVWIIFGAALIFAIITKFSLITWGLLLVLLLLAIISEVADYIFTYAGVRQLGAAKITAIISVISSIVGALIGAISFNIIVSIVFSFLFGFLGAFITELIRKSKVEDATARGIGSVLGLTAAIFLKVIIAITMVIIIVFNVF